MTRAASGALKTDVLTDDVFAKTGTLNVPATRSQRAGHANTATDPGSVQNVSFHITNPVAEPTSETARKASAYIGVNV